MGIAKVFLKAGERGLASAAHSAGREGSQSAKDIMKGGFKRGVRNTSHQTPRSVAANETKNLSNTVKEVDRGGSAVAANADRIGAGARNVLVGSAAAGATVYGIYKADQTINKGEELLSKGAGVAGQAFESAKAAEDRAKQAAKDAAAAARDKAEDWGAHLPQPHLPPFPEVHMPDLPNPANLLPSTAALSDLTGNVTYLLVAGLAVFVAYEGWRFSRSFG